MKRIRNLITVFLVLLPLSVPALQSQPLPAVSPEDVGFSSERLDRLDRKIIDNIEKGYIPGGVGILARDGKVFYEKAFGHRDLLLKDEMKIDTIFRVASMSKPITAVAAMILFEDGKFLLTDSLSKFIPEFENVMVMEAVENPAQGEQPYKLVSAKSRLTVRHLLNFTSGISYGSGPHRDLYREAGIQNGIGAPGTGTIGENIRKLAALPLLHHPGERFTYGLNSDVLGYFIEIVSGMPFDEFCRTHLFEPLQMYDTAFFVPLDKLDRFAPLYRGGRDSVIDPDTVQTPEEPRTMFSGGAGIRTTAGDYIRFAQMILNGGELDGVRILGPKTVAIMTTNQIGDSFAAFRDGSGDKYGLGFGIRTERGVFDSNESLGVLGWDGAFTTRFWIDPAENLVGVFMYQIQGKWSILYESRALTYQALIKPKEK
ncbi:serine hydrolase domain-containing protein [Candidatus Latescibacterota bacterium]